MRIYTCLLLTTFTIKCSFLAITDESESAQRLEQQITSTLVDLATATTAGEVANTLSQLWSTIRLEALSLDEPDQFSSTQEQAEYVHEIKTLAGMTGLTLRALRCAQPHHEDRDPQREQLYRHARLPNTLHPVISLFLDSQDPSERMQATMRSISSGPLARLIGSFKHRYDHALDIELLAQEIEEQLPELADSVRYDSWHHDILLLGEHLFWFEALIAHELRQLVTSHGVHDSVPAIAHMQTAVTGLRRLLYLAAMTKQPTFQSFIEQEALLRHTLHEEEIYQDSAQRRMAYTLPARLQFSPTAGHRSVCEAFNRQALIERLHNNAQKTVDFTSFRGSFHWNNLAEVYWSRQEWANCGLHMRSHVRDLLEDVQECISSMQRQYPTEMPENIQSIYQEATLLRSLCESALEVPPHQVPLSIPRFQEEAILQQLGGDLECQRTIQASFLAPVLDQPRFTSSFTAAALRCLSIAHQQGHLKSATTMCNHCKAPLLALHKRCFFNPVFDIVQMKKTVAIWRLLHLAAEGEKITEANALEPRQFPKRIRSGFVRPGFE